MLRELQIRNLAVIEDVRLELQPGLNCFTGQTGAGKSLVLGAFETLLGIRSRSKSLSTAQMLRPGADEAHVSGVFEVRHDWAATQISELIDATVNQGDELLITRRLQRSGRTSARVNGQPATATMLKSLGQLLVDVHGQHDHQYLLKPANQLWILDAFGRLLDQRNEYELAANKLKELHQQRVELLAGRDLRHQQQELYTFQAGEIDAVSPTPNEFTQVKKKHKRLSNLHRIKSDADAVHGLLHENENAVSQHLNRCATMMKDLADLDPDITPIANQTHAVAALVQDLSHELARYVDRIEPDAGALAEAEDRLNTLNRLIAKYANRPERAAQPNDDDPVAGIIAYREYLQEQLTSLTGQNEDLDQLDQHINDAHKKLAKLAKKLDAARRAAAIELAEQIGDELKDLGMPDAKLDVVFSDNEPDDTAPPQPAGVEFNVRTNPGQPAKPLHQIASGGELSRIMLSIKSILADNDHTSVLVFDEIDANVGGRMGTVIGSKLRRLAKRGHQVLCITHLPQIAAFADTHLRIEKSVTGRGEKRETRTTVVPLTGKAKIDELAEMLAGSAATPTTRKQAREMVSLASA